MEEKNSTFSLLENYMMTFDLKPKCYTSSIITVIIFVVIVPDYFYVIICVYWSNHIMKLHFCMRTNKTRI